MIYYSVKETATLLGVSKRTIYRWIAWGYIKTIRSTPTSDHRVSQEEINRILGG